MYLLLLLACLDSRSPIDTHLTGVHADLSHTPTLTDSVLQARRSASLRALDAYVAEGVFPHNHTEPIGKQRTRPVVGAMPPEPGRSPVFVDEHDTPCAVAHLMRTSGAHDLVERIRLHDNTAYLHDLIEVPGVSEWIAASGFTVDELARIQPAYCHTAPHTKVQAVSLGVLGGTLTTSSAVQLANDRRPWFTLGLGTGVAAAMTAQGTVLMTRLRPEDRRRGAIEAGAGVALGALNAVGFVLAANPDGKPRAVLQADTRGATIVGTW